MDIMVFKDTPLLHGIQKEEWDGLLSCIGAATKRYAAGEALLLCGEEVKRMGIVLSGRVQVMREDRHGARELAMELGTGELFGEALACVNTKESPVAVFAAAETSVLWMEVGRVLQVCPSSCPFHQRLVRNLVAVLAERNLQLNEKMNLLSKRSLREKLLAYFAAEAKKQGGGTLRLSFTREELADYLCVDRSALSRELSRMGRDGLVQVNGRSVALLS